MEFQDDEDKTLGQKSSKRYPETPNRKKASKTIQLKNFTNLRGINYEDKRLIIPKALTSNHDQTDSKAERDSFLVSPLQFLNFKASC